MNSNVKFYEKDDELYWIHFPVRLEVLKEVNVLGEIQIPLILMYMCIYE